MAWMGCGKSDDRLWGKRLFVFSILTIIVLSVMMSVDFTRPVPPHMLLTYAH
jgi:protoheme IX farnesyltransferase